MIYLVTRKVNAEQSVDMELMPFFRADAVSFYNLDKSGFLFEIDLFTNWSQVTCYTPNTESHARALGEALLRPEITEDQFLDALAKVFPNHEEVVPLKRGI